MYQELHPNPLTGQPEQCIKRLSDNAFIPFDPTNTDYQAYLKWVSEGNEPLPAEQIITQGDLTNEESSQ